MLLVEAARYKSRIILGSSMMIFFFFFFLEECFFFFLLLLFFFVLCDIDERDIDREYEDERMVEVNVDDLLALGDWIETDTDARRGALVVDGAMM